MRGRNKMRTRVGLRPTGGGVLMQWGGGGRINGTAYMVRRRAKWPQNGINMVWGLWGGPSMPWAVLKIFLIPPLGINMPKSMPWTVV